MPVLTKPLLSIIVTSYTTERLKDVLDLLDSIKGQTYLDIETILVVEESTELIDCIGAYVKERGIPNVRLIFDYAGIGASSARNLGIKDARGEFIAFVDDDAVLFPNWVEEMMKTYAQDSSIIGVMGLTLPLWEDESMKWFPEEFHWMIGCNTWYDWNGITDIRNVWTNNASFRKEAFNLAGPFSTRIGPRRGSMEGRKRKISEDVELSIRVKWKTGKRIVYNPQVRLWHKVYKYRFKWKYVIQWSYWMGISKRILEKAYSKDFKNENLIAPEHQLLKRIFTRLFPTILKNFFQRPVIALRKLSMTIVILAFVALGYFLGFFLKSS